jgi:ureidoglycolate hydrolase
MDEYLQTPAYFLDAIDFTKYGQVIRIPGEKDRRPDFESDDINFYGALGIFDLKVPVEFGICTVRKREFVVAQLEQHNRTQELLYAVDDDFVIPVAPNIVLGSKNAPDLENLVAVRFRRGEGVIFRKGVWHGVPYPFKKKSFALVGFAKNTAKKDFVVHTLSRKIKMRIR